MTMTTTKNESIYDILSAMDEYELVCLYNDYCDNAGYYDDRIYNMDEFDELMNGSDPLRIANMIFYGDFCPNHDYFRFNGYGNLESFDFVNDYIDIDEIVDYIIENEESFYNSDIQDILDEWESDEEDEDE